MRHKPQDSVQHWTRSMQAQMTDQRQRLQARDPAQLAENSGAGWQPTGSDSGTLMLDFLGMPLRVPVPEYTIITPDGDDAPTMIQGLVTTYLLRAIGAPRAGEWIAFRELPDGMFYHQAFQGYSGNVLVRAMGDDIVALRRGAMAMGGGRLTGFGDAAYEFRVLPRLWLAVVYWLGDEEDGFPPKANVLFDRAASLYMITDGLAIIGGQLIRRIIQAAQA